MKDGKEPFNLIVCGTGGQGNVLLSRFIARVMSKNGYEVTIGETFTASQRGGAVMSHVRLSKERRYGALIPEGKASFIVSLEPMETLRVLGIYGNPGVGVLSNTHTVYPIQTITGEKTYPPMDKLKQAIRDLSEQCWLLDATQISLEMGNPILANMVMIGALVQTKAMDISRENMANMIRETFAAKVAETNIEAANRGMQSLEKLA